MENITLCTSVYNSSNKDYSIEELRYKSCYNKAKDCQSRQDASEESFENQLMEVIELVSQKIKFNQAASGVYQGTLISTQNGNEYIRNCLSIPELYNLSLEEFRFISTIDPSRLKFKKDLSELYSKTHHLPDLNNLKPRTATSMPVSIQVSWV